MSNQKMFLSLAKNLDEINRSFPKAGVYIEAHWAEECCHNYIIDLLTNTRGGQRSGFSSNIYDCLMKVYAMHVSTYGDYGHPLTVSIPNLDVHS